MADIVQKLYILHKGEHCKDAWHEVFSSEGKMMRWVKSMEWSDVGLRCTEVILDPDPETWQTNDEEETEDVTS